MWTMLVRLKLRSLVRKLRLTPAKIAVICSALVFIGIVELFIYHKTWVEYDRFMISYEQMLEDYDYFWSAVENDVNFPTKVWANQGFDYQAWRDKNRKKITPRMTHPQFAKLMRDCGETLYPTARFSLLRRGSFERHPGGFYALQIYLWLEPSLITKPTQSAPQPLEKTEFAELKRLDSNVYSGKITSEGIAIIQPQVFAYSYSYNTLMNYRAFYDSISDYGHLIIDIRSNPGGGTDSWRYPILTMLASRSMTYERHLTIDSGQAGQAYQGHEYIGKLARAPADIWLTEHPEAQSFIEQYYGGDTDIYTMTEVIHASRTGGFQGKIWLLVDEHTFGSADWLAGFCAQTGFATLVGTRTGGNGVYTGLTDGYGYVTLPNSKLTYRYLSDIGINADGTSNIEHGSAPDIYTEQDALEHVLSLIRSGEWQ